MNGEKAKGFSAIRTDDILIFRTSRYRSGRGSVLHSGIYNKEFASALSSFVLAGGFYVLAAMSFRRTVYLYLLSALIFGAAFPLFRKFVFRDSFLEAVFDLAAGKTEIFLVGVTRKKRETLPIMDIEKVLIESEKTKIDNRDAVEFVEKISAQHGTVIPGFGEETTFFLLTLKLSDGTERMIYADSDMQDVIDAHSAIKEFLKI